MSHNHVYQFQSKLNRAKAGILDQGMINTFERRGVIIAKASGDITIDTAEEDAIEFGAEEVSKPKIDSVCLEILEVETSLSNEAE